MRTWPFFLLLLSAVCAAQTERVRPAVVAGSWYSNDPKKLREEIHGYFALAPKVELGGPVIALISPHAGYQFSGRCAAAAYALLRGRDVRRVIVLAPSHYVAFYGGSIADVDFYETPLGKIPLDRKACDAILKSPLVETVARAHQREHSLEMQLPFLQVALERFQLVPIVLGQLRDEDYPKLADMLRDHMDAHTVVVASSDFTHYGRAFDYAPFRDDVPENIEKLDKGAIELALKLDSAGFRQYVAKTGATICGRVPIALLLETLTPDCRGKLVNYYMSGELNNDFSHSVSYASVAFAVGPGEVSAQGQKKLLEITRETLRATLAAKDLPAFDVPEEELQVKRGVFVTYKNKGRLRGCIGRFETTEPLWKVVRHMAVASARHDLRFVDDPVVLREEPNIDIEISILSPMTRIRDPLAFIPGVHGLYVRRGDRAGTYLPQVAEELGADRRTFISHLCRNKIGLPADAWKDPGTEVFIYSAQVFGDKQE